MKIRGIEVDFNFLDADDAERFEKEAERVKQECEIKGKKEMTYSQTIREECKVIDNFFDNVFGKGISFKMFQGKNNLEDHINAFEDIVKEKMEQQKGLQNTFDRYQPNREQRRYNQYHKGNRK
nr:MAG TPA: hypothetical protein [Caudoviricetes sp.]